MSQALVIAASVRMRTALQVILRTLPPLTLVETAANVELALQMMKRFPYPLIVVDAALGARQTYRLARKISVLPFCIKTILIVNSKTEERLAVAARANVILQRGFSTEQLQAAVTDLLQDTESAPVEEHLFAPF